MQQQKPHYKVTNKMLALNSVMRRLPFYNQGMSAHLFGTKHSKSYGEYGWPLQMDFWYYKHVYDRVGLARAVVNLPVSLCWLTHPMIKDAKTEEESEQFKEFAERTGYWRSCKDADRTQRVGHYGGMIAFVRDGKPLSTPLEANSINLDDVVEFMPFWEGQLIPGTIDSNQQSPRYGLPIEYTYNNRGVFKPNQRDGGDSFTVHHTRVRIRNEGAIGRTIYGESAIEPVFNALIDWEKKRGAGGEGAWRICAARPILKALAETAGQTPTDEEMEALLTAIGDMNTSFDSLPYLGGMDVTTLNQDLPDLQHYFQADKDEIAAGSGISQAGLLGHVTGKLAGDKDSSHDKEMAQSRREGYLSEEIKLDLKWLGQICRDFDDRGLIVEWTDLSEPSDQVRLENIAKMADINYKTWQATGSIAFSIDEMREKAMYLPQAEIKELPFKEGETGAEDKPTSEDIA